MKDVYLKTKGEIEKALDSSPQGLTTTEANSRFQKFGPNALEETKKQTTLQVFLSQFKDGHHLDHCCFDFRFNG